jgi:protein-tyrosine phosphatase
MVVEQQLGGRILVVCTGNVCRSPFIERLLGRELAGLGIAVESAGTGALVGEPIDPSAADQVRAHGADPGNHVARQLTAGLIAEADLVLTATRRHRGEVAVMSPRALRYAFAWNDFAELVHAMSAEQLDQRGRGRNLRQVVAAVAARRGSVPPRSAPEVDIVDPYRQGPAAFDQMGREVMVSLPDVVRALRR